MNSAVRFLLIAATMLLLASCQSGASDGTVNSETAETYAGIAEDEVLRFAGNEPFWGGRVAGTRLIYTTPENPDGQAITVKRFAGMNGLGFSGVMDGAAFDMAVTPGECNDAMADRTYPFLITLSIGGNVRTGCGWTDAQPFTGPESL